MKNIELDLDDFLRVDDLYVNDSRAWDGWYTQYVVTFLGVVVGKYAGPDHGMGDYMPIYDKGEVEERAERAVMKLWELAGE